MKCERTVPAAADMEALGARLAPGLKPGMVIFLHGELGAGKTTLIRGILHARGHRGAVKSPTYTLVEPYALPSMTVYHFDFYRLGHPEELEFLGIRDYLEGQGASLIEWAERGAELMPEPDIDVYIERVDDGRCVRLVSHTTSGAALLSGLT